MTIIRILSWLVFGLIIGAIARFLIPGRQNIGLPLTIGLGVIGSFAGGLVSTVVFAPTDSLIQPSGWIMSIIGALIVLFVYTRVIAQK